jgi:hypothetical protein
MASAPRDRWAEWLAERRFGDDPEIRQRFLSNLARTREKVLDGGHDSSKANACSTWAAARA